MWHRLRLRQYAAGPSDYWLRFFTEASCGKHSAGAKRLKTDFSVSLGGCEGRRTCWSASCAVTGRFDVVDIVQADSPADVEKAAMMIRGYGPVRPRRKAP